jgi:uncharacterized membrane protein
LIIYICSVNNYKYLKRILFAGTKQISDLLKYWRTRAQRSKIAHYRTSDYFSRLHYWFGIPVVVFSAAVGTSVFAFLQQKPANGVQIAVGLASLSAAVLASLQTFFGFSARASKHKTAAANFGAIQREIEEVLTIKLEDVEDIKEKISNIRERIDALARSSIDTPRRIWLKAEEEVKRINPDARLTPNKSLHGA